LTILSPSMKAAGHVQRPVLTTAYGDHLAFLHQLSHTRHLDAELLGDVGEG